MVLDSVPKVLLSDGETVLYEDLLHKLGPGFVEELCEELLHLRRYIQSLLSLVELLHLCALIGLIGH